MLALVDGIPSADNRARQAIFCHVIDWEGLERRLSFLLYHSTLLTAQRRDVDPKLSFLHVIAIKNVCLVPGSSLLIRPDVSRILRLLLNHSQGAKTIDLPE